MIKQYFFLLLVSVYSMAADGQNRLTFKGMVTDKNNRPLQSVAVFSKITNAHVTSDPQGDFVISLMYPDTLIIQHIGYETKKVWTGRDTTTHLHIVLDSVQSDLGDVIVSTGYQQLPKERATGSFEQVDKQLFAQRASSDILSRLEGTSSVLFDKNSNRPPLTIRGLSTINGPTSPLIIVDNFPYDGDIGNINPNDVQSITLLKDAAAASIWGTRAGNGVIVITTKKGSYNEPLSINVTSSVTTGGKPDLYYLKQMSPSDEIDVEEYLFRQGFYDNYLGNNSKPMVSPVVTLLEKAKDGLLSEEDALQQINLLRSEDLRRDYKKYIYQNSTDQQYHIGFNGGSLRDKYYFSSGFDKDIDNLNGVFNRVNLRLENTYKPLSNLEISAGIQYSWDKTLSGNLPYAYSASVYGLYPYLSLIDGQGNEVPVNRYRPSYLDTAGQGRLLDWHYYPMTDYLHNRTHNDANDVLVDASAQYTFLRGLTASVKYQFERQVSETNVLHDTSGFYARDLINRYSQVNYDDGTVTYNIPVGSILDRSVAVLTSQDLRGQLSYNRDFNRYSIDAIAGGEIRQAQTNAGSYRIYGYNTDILTTSNVDYVHTFPDFISGQRNAIPSGLNESGLLNRFVSVFANAAYTYDRRFTLSASARRDASNLFGVNTNNKWTPLWSVGAGWNIAHEYFYHFSFFPALKLRATYGLSGNVDQDMSAVTTLLYFSNAANYTNLKQAVIDQFANPDLRWERTAMTNIGIDFSARKQILYGSIDFYFKKGKDLFGAYPIDYTTGAGDQGVITRNVADIKGAGVDISLGSDLVQGKNIRWVSGLIISWNHTEVAKYYQASDNGFDYVSDGVTKISPLSGKPVYSVVSLKWGGLDNKGDPIGFADGQPSTDYAAILGSGTKISDLVFSGSATPALYGSWNNTIRYKRWSLSVTLLYKFGYYFRKNAIDYGLLFSNTPQTSSDYALRWQNPGDEQRTSVPAMVYPDNTNRDAFYRYSSVLVDKGDHIRLQFVNLAFNIMDGHGRHHDAIKNLDGFINLNNAGLIWKANKDGIDPDYPNTLPPPATISFGIKANF